MAEVLAISPHDSWMSEPEDEVYRQQKRRYPSARAKPSGAINSDADQDGGRGVGGSRALCAARPIP
jgi:hypothetical protein